MPYRCNTCNRSFRTRNELTMHQQSHLPANIPCLARCCNKMFKSQGGMLIHMEHGNCTSGVDHEIVNMHAAQLFQWKKIIADGNEYLRDQLLDCEEPDEAPFECPECGDRFYKLSSLVQHVDSYACDCELDERPMVQLMGWLRKKLWSY